MEYTTLGRTGLKVSVAGLGCGGFSRLGARHRQERGRRDRDHPRGARSRGQSVRHRGGLRHRAGARQGARRRPARQGRDLHQGAVRHQQPQLDCRSAPSPASTSSLRQLGTDYIDVYQLHGIAPRAYDHALEVLAPALLREKEKGKFRWLGITETAPRRSRAPDDPARRARRRVGCRHGRVPHDAPERAPPRLPADPANTGSGHC